MTSIDVGKRDQIVLRPNLEQWNVLQKTGVRATPSDLSDISRVATVGRWVGNLPTADGIVVPVVLHYPKSRVLSVDDLGTLPVGVGGKLVPLKALAKVDRTRATPSIYREDDREAVTIEGKLSHDKENQSDAVLAKADDLVKKWKEEKKDLGSVSVTSEDAMKDLHEALSQLGHAVGLSVLLIFLTMVLQFGSLANALLVLVAVPLGFIGVLASIWLFKSTLSLNSVLGVILLNGIAVANSIILVDFLKKLVERGKAPREAAFEAAQKRLRPIVMTSMTTGLGMLPIALGLGEGGKILQPLGIAVVGGLGFSMLMTLFIVPTLQVNYLEFSKRRKLRRSQKPNAFLEEKPAEMTQ